MLSQKPRYLVGISNEDKKNLRRLATNFFLNGDVFYKKNHDMFLLICVDKPEADMIIKEIHDESFGIHANGYSMTRKILMVEYYLLIMESRYFSYVKKCYKCHIYADKVHVPPNPLKILTAP